MKKILQQLKYFIPPFRGAGIILLLLSLRGQAQTYGNEIRAKDNPGVIGLIKRTNDGLKTADSALLAKLNAGVSVTLSGTNNINNISGTISLPTGAATSANQTTEIGHLATIAGKDFSTETTLSALNTKIPSNLTVTSTRLLVDPSGVTSPISAASLPLPTGASTLGEQQTQTTALQLIDNIVSGSGVNISQINGVTPLMGSGIMGTGSLRVTIASDNDALTVKQATSSNLKAQVDPLTIATWGLVVEDVGETAANNLLGIGLVRRDAPASSAGTTGDNATFNAGSKGALWTAETAQHGGGVDFKTGSIGATKTDVGTANTPTSIYGIDFYNSNVSVAYVQFFNAQASAVTLGTTAPDYAVGIPTGSGYTRVYLPPLHFSTAVSIAITTTRTGSTSPTNTVDYNIDYKQ